MSCPKCESEDFSVRSRVMRVGVVAEEVKWVRFYLSCHKCSEAYEDDSLKRANDAANLKANFLCHENIKKSAKVADFYNFHANKASQIKTKIDALQ